MAAVAAEPGAAAISTGSTAAMDDEGPPEPGPGLPVVPLQSEGPRESGPAVELLVVRVEDGGDGEERRHVRPELEPAAGKALCEDVVTDELINNLPRDRVSLDRVSLDLVSLDRFAPGLPGDPERSGNVSVQAVYRSILPDPQPSAVFLHSFPAPPPGAEAGLSLAEPAVPTTNVTTDRAEAAGRDRGYTVLVQTELRPGPAEDALLDGNADRLSGPVNPDGLDPETGFIKNTAGNEEPPGCGLQDSSTPCRSPKRRLLTDKQEDTSRLLPEPGPLASFQDLSPGSEVRVCLDHVIDDALVVSFRRGEKVFSGVLMDVSRRFGPYGIPITVFPKRDDNSRLQTFLQSRPVTNDETSTKQEQATISPPAPPPHHPWTAKPPPLFHEGAPYPPPLFIRDTYNQALPQPLPRKIKRPKRRYRCEEPTSIMNAIKLRPRQVLCDKCKGVVASGGNREARRGLVDLRGEEASRRRRAAEGPISSEVKRLRSDDKGGRMATDRRASSGICRSSSPRRVLRGVTSSSSSSSSSGPLRLKLNSKKALAKDSASDRSKARQVLQKLARSSQPPPLREPKDQSQIQDRTKAVTRAAALQNHNQKVHFTRRLQHLSGTAVSTSRTPLPPRMRLKPQRYRTDDNQGPPPPPPKQGTRSSPLKPDLDPTPTSDLVPPTALPFLSQASPSSTCAVSVVVETHEVCTDQGGGRGGGEGPPPPPPSSSSFSDSSHSECGSSETFEPAPTGDPPSLLSPAPSPASLAPLYPPSSSPIIPPLRSDSEEPQVGGGEEDEEGGELKRRRKSSTSSSSSSSSSSSTVFSKSVSKCPLPDGRTVCVGDIVWAKIYGFPWWPARVLGITVVRRGDTGLAVRQEARVSWFGSPTTSFLPLAQLSPFLETFQSRFDRKRKGPYRRAIAEAASAAKQLTPEVRALLTQFET
ncbi:PWWP domain-containing protein 2A [Pleuronectes platessa]|uniref:PWWP domain-containing protein 2A n=1 Tax=Pleuronectes platessa TaxID=8262 RepID=UPI00232A249E|nr:PWWP domain-containing protein 2A [Pleuronectes platessa]